MNKRKLLTLALTLCMVAILAIGGTLAYFQDTDYAKNTMIIGKVDIRQNEQQWDEEGKKMVDFKDDKALMPYVGTINSWNEDDPTNRADKEAGITGAYRRFEIANAVDKYISVTNEADPKEFANDATKDAYVRTIVALEMGAYDSKADWQYNVIGWSYNDLNGNSGSRLWKVDNVGVVKINNHNYYVQVFTYSKELKAGETTIPSFLQVYLGQNVNNAEVTKLDGNNNGKYDILALTQATQTLGFTDGNGDGIVAEEALNTAFGALNGNNIADWLKAVETEA